MNQNDCDRYYRRVGYKWSGDGRSDEQVRTEAIGPAPRWTRPAFVILVIGFIGTTITLLFSR